MIYYAKTHFFKMFKLKHNKRNFTYCLIEIFNSKKLNGRKIICIKLMRYQLETAVQICCQNYVTMIIYIYIKKKEGLRKFLNFINNYFKVKETETTFCKIQNF